MFEARSYQLGLRIRHWVVLIVIFALTGTAAGASWDQWRVVAKESRLESYLGRDALLLKNGIAWLDGSSFRDGVIELDVAAPADVGFHGLAFRAQDDQDYEHVYLRWHRSGQTDASQYEPVFHGVSGWQIYTGPRFSLPVSIVPDRWIHLEVRVRGERLEVFVDGQPLIFPQLVRPIASGRIGLTASGAPVHFANVEIRAGAAPAMTAGEGAPARVIPPGTVRQWRVSTPFAESRIPSDSRLDRRDWDDLRWDMLESGVAGIANLATIRRLEPERNSVFAAVTLHATHPHLQRARIGFSDRVVVFLNGRPLYRGRAEFQSRDHRFLGTVGLFDELILPLERGDNELWFAVSEDFGGWGVILQLIDSGDERHMKR